MKTLYFLLFLLCAPILLQAQTPEIRRFYRQQKIKEGAVKVFLPGWVVKMGVAIAGKEIGEEKDLVKKAVRPMHNLRVLTVENPTASKLQSIKKMVNGAKAKNFKDLIMVRSQGTSVNIMMKDKVKKKSGVQIVKKLLILVAETDEIVIVSLKGRWNLQKILQEVKELDIIKKQDKLPLPLLKQAAPQA